MRDAPIIHGQIIFIISPATRHIPTVITAIIIQTGIKLFFIGSTGGLNITWKNKIGNLCNNNITIVFFPKYESGFDDGIALHRKTTAKVPQSAVTKQRERFVYWSLLTLQITLKK